MRVGGAVMWPTTFSHIHDESLTWACPDCNSPVAAIIVMPTDKRSIMLLGRCTKCFAHGDTATSYAKLACTIKEWEDFVMIPDMPVRKEK
jgi:hypothetical protein